MRRSATALPESADYVVVGAGAAGSVVAARLAGLPGASVCLLEAGGEDSHPWIRVPIGYARLIHNPGVNWGYETQPEPGLGGRRIAWPRGRVLGGSASINGLVFLRGAPGDFDDWAALGARGWAYDDVLPYFRRLERSLQPGVEAQWHGATGPIPVSQAREPSAVARAFVQAAVELGHPFNPDFNGQQLEGAGFLPFNAERGRRVTSARAYLRPALASANAPSLVLRARAQRVVFEGLRAVGVEVRRDDGSVATVRARREVILCGGAVNTPQLLMLSGVGEGSGLQALGIRTVVDAPGVGQGLQDHLMARFAFRCTQPVTLNDVMRSPLRMAQMGMRYLLTGTGPMAVAAAEASLFTRVQAQPARPVSARVPQLQFQVANFSLDSYASGLHRFPGFVYSVCVCRPDSRGRVALASADPQAPPRLFANYLAEPYDRAAMLEGFRLGRRLAATRALAPWIAHEFKPGPDVQDDEALLGYIRQTASTTFHPCGSVAMGAEGAPLDAALRVRGTEGLRVIDASAMPAMPATNIHAATLMLAEKGADLVRADTR